MRSNGQAFKSIHLVCEWIDYPRPLFGVCIQTSGYRILSNVIHLRREVLATFIVSQTMIEISFLPSHSVLARVKAFPTTDDTAHCYFTRK